MQQGTQLKRHICLHHLIWITSNQKYVYDCTCVLSPSRFLGLRKNHLTYISLRQNRTTTQLTPRNQGEIKDCDCTGAVQMRTDFKHRTSHWNQVDHLLRTLRFHSSPEFPHISTKRKKCGLIFHWLVSSDWWTSCSRKMWTPVESFPGVGPGQGLFSGGHHSFSFSVLIGSLLCLSLIFCKLHPLPHLSSSVKLGQQVLTLLGSLGDTQSAKA